MFWPAGLTSRWKIPYHSCPSVNLPAQPLIRCACSRPMLAHCSAVVREHGVVARRIDPRRWGVAVLVGGCCAVCPARAMSYRLHPCGRRRRQRLRCGRGWVWAAQASPWACGCGAALHCKRSAVAARCAHVGGPSGPVRIAAQSRHRPSPSPCNRIGRAYCCAAYGAPAPPYMPAATTTIAKNVFTYAFI